MRHGWLVVASMAATAAAVPGNRPGAVPATLPRPPAAARPLPDPYRLLLTRSIFARDGVASAPTVGGRDEVAAAAAAAPALRGVVLSDGAFVAVIEDPADHKVQNLGEGALLAGGRVGRISLQGLDFERGGGKVFVAIGHDLRGAAAPPILAAAPNPHAPETAPSPEPAVVVPPGIDVAALRRAGEQHKGHGAPQEWRAQ